MAFISKIVPLSTQENMYLDGWIPLFATCKKHDINPQHWLLDILRKLNDPDYEGKFSDLLPHRWKENPS